jgi:hypothetical protein
MPSKSAWTAALSVRSTASPVAEAGSVSSARFTDTGLLEATGTNVGKTDYTYDPLGHPDTVTIDQLAPLKDQFYDYTWDARACSGR